MLRNYVVPHKFIKYMIIILSALISLIVFNIIFNKLKYIRLIIVLNN